MVMGYTCTLYVLILITYIKIRNNSKKVKIIVDITRFVKIIKPAKCMCSCQKHLTVISHWTV